MAETTIILDKRHKNNDDTYTIKLRINNNYTSAMISQPYKIKETDWDSDNNKIKKCCRKYNSVEINLRLMDFKQKFDAFLFNLNINENIANYTASELKNLFQKEKDNKTNEYFITLFQSVINKKKEDKPNSQTYNSYASTLIHLNNFCSSPLKIKNIDTNFLENFTNYLKSRNNKTNSIAVHLKNIRSVYNYGIKIGIADYNSYPFRNFKIQSEETEHRTITVEDLLKLFNYKGTPSEEKALDLFKLSFYLIGINFKDLLYTKKSDVYNGRLYYKRAKTHKNLSVKIMSEAQSIIDKYPGNELILNIIEYKQKIAKEDRNSELHKDVVKQTNKQLKSICKKLDINIDISTYYARHTWATVARKAKVDYDIIKLALGHSNKKKDVTAVYIEYDTDLIDEANEKVITYLYNNHKYINR